LSEMVERAAHAADEIEITPEMIRAGARELLRFDPRYESGEDAVERIYAAMRPLEPYTAEGLDKTDPPHTPESTPPGRG
jgi:hypothetical protein